jgi:hypothetical protein
MNIVSTAAAKITGRGPTVIISQVEHCPPSEERNPALKNAQISVQSCPSVSTDSTSVVSVANGLLGPKKIEN